MARPRKPDDPERRREIPCDRCGGGYYLVVNWGPSDQICGYCYQQAKRTRGTCSCGHVGVLPGRIGGRPACRTCADIRLNIDCARCGNEDELYRHNLCWPCALGDVVDETLAHPDTGQTHPDLLALAAALKSMKRANSGLTWIRQKHVSDFLKHLAAEPVITHEAIDALPRSRTRDHVRGLLVEHGVLPQRDEIKIRYQEWAAKALERVANDRNRAVIDSYIRWHHLWRMNQMPTVSHGTFLRSKQTVTVAINFLNWLDERGSVLGELTQADVDDWINAGPTTHLIIDRFLNWARRQQIVPVGLKVPAHRRGTSKRLGATQQDQALGQAIDNHAIPARDRAAAVLALVFGQQIEDVVKLKWDRVGMTDEMVTVTLGTLTIALPQPLDLPWRELRANPVHAQTAAHPNSPWVFRGQSPGQHVHASQLRWRLRDILTSTRAARLGTLHELTKTTPVAIIAEALGYSPATLERHATASGADYARYIANVIALQG